MPSATLSCNKNVAVSSKYTSNSYRNGYLAFGRGSSNDEYRLLLDFTSAASVIPSGATIEKATLTVPKTTGSIGSNAGFTVTANRITSTWTTGSSWGSGNPSYTDTGAATAAAGDGHTGNISFDVTAIVSAWMSGSTQYGIVLRKSTSGGIYIKVAQELGAYISVTYGYKASAFTTDGSATAGTSETISVSAQSSALTHDLILAFGSGTWTLASKVTAANLKSWTPPMAVCNQIPNATSGKGTLTLKTYSGSTLIGSTSKSVTIRVPASVVPTLTGLSAAIAGNATAAGWGVYVKNFSKVKLTASGAAGSYGSTIKSYNFSGNGWSKVASTNTATSATLTDSGSIKFTVTATDSRGRISAAETVTISVSNYASPAFTSASASRANSAGTVTSDGTHILVQAAASHSSISNNNKLTIKASVSPGNWSGTLSGGKVLLAGGGAAISTTYTVTVTATDTLGEKATRTLTVFPVERIFNVTSAGDGAAIGGYAEKGKFSVFWPVNLVGAVQFGNPGASRINLGAAPSGYGLGTSNYWLDDGADIDTETLANGWYSYGEGNISPNKPFAIGDIFTLARGTSVRGVQIASDRATGVPTLKIRNRLDSEWSDWYWVNPSMVVGTEYRTLERSAGTVVFAKRIRYSFTGTIGSETTVTNITIPHGISGFSSLVRCEGRMPSVNYQLPYISTKGGITAISAVNSTNIVLRIANTEWAANTFEFDVYYTKT